MKYRITSNGHYYRIEYKYKWWPFWLKYKNHSEGGSYIPCYGEIEEPTEKIQKWLTKKERSSKLKGPYDKLVREWEG